MTSEPATYPGYRFPAAIISYGVWLYHVFGLSMREVELILAERGIGVTHESVRQWCRKFGADFARKFRQRRPKPGDTWHLDEVFLKIGGELRYLWRAVDQHGVVLDVLVQGRRNAAAAKGFSKRLLARLRYRSKRLVTDGLRSYGVAHREVKHGASRYLNNRAENPHRPTRRRERQMQRFKSPEHGQHFLSSHAMIYGHFRSHFRPRWHMMTAGQYRHARSQAFQVWREETRVQVAA